MKRLAIDFTLVLAMVALPAAILDSIEVTRLAIVGVAYALVVVLTTSARGQRTLSRRTRLTLELAMAGVLFSLAWLQSFPANSHSSEIGLYIAFGVGVLSRALTRRDEAKSDAETARLRAAERALLAVWS